MPALNCCWCLPDQQPSPTNKSWPNRVGKGQGQLPIRVMGIIGLCLVASYENFKAVLILLSLTHCPHHFQMHLLPLTPPRRLGYFLGVKSGSFTDFSYTHLVFILFLVCKILYYSSIYFLAFNILMLLYPIVNILYIFVV